MRVRIYSDLHLESAAFDPPNVTTDVIVLAGDIGEGLAGLTWAREKFDAPIIYVRGNHELYGQRLPEADESFSAEAKRLGICFLENASTVINGVRFLGATLWTDFRINGYSRPSGPDDDDVRIAMGEAKRLMNDYRYIRFGRKRKKARDRMTPVNTLSMHIASRDWLQRSLAETFDGRTVVVTHHAPHLLSVPTHRVGDRYTPYYASHLPQLVRAPVDLWIHGHFHTSCDYTIGTTRVISNPRGRSGDDNPAFNANFTLTL